MSLTKISPVVIFTSMGLFVLALHGAVDRSATLVQTLTQIQRVGMEDVRAKIARAQAAGDEHAVKQHAAEALGLSGTQAGLPDVADPDIVVGNRTLRLTPTQRDAASVLLLTEIQQRAWWRRATKPTELKHALRETAEVIRACLAARRADLASPRARQFLAISEECAQFMLQAQAEAGTGVFPFPAVRAGQGRAFEVAERFLAKVEQDGKSAEVIHHGWIAADPYADGGLQFDNGLAGCALFELYTATEDKRYLDGARKATDWAATSATVPNWNYNAFSLQLLSQGFLVTGEKRYLTAARRKFTLGVEPGQLTAGARAGRWMDGHNARPSYHYIIVRALISYVQALPAEDRVAASRVLAMAATRDASSNAQGRLTNIDSAIGAFSAYASMQPAIAGPSASLDLLEAYVVAGLQTGRPPCGPEALGLLLERSASRK